MPKMDIKKYQEKIELAKQIVEGANLEEPFKTNAFNTVLKSLLEKEGQTVSLKQTEEGNIGVKNEKKIDEEIDHSKIPYFDNFEKLGWKEKILNILRWARLNDPRGGLSSGEIVKIFHVRFAMKYVDSTKINKEITRRLLKTPYITRKKLNERDFLWFITPQGEEFLGGKKNG